MRICADSNTRTERRSSNEVRCPTIQDVVGLICSLSAGALLQAWGWQVLNLVLLPWLALTTLVLVWFWYTQRRSSAAMSVSTHH